MLLYICEESEKEQWEINRLFFLPFLCSSWFWVAAESSFNAFPFIEHRLGASPILIFVKGVGFSLVLHDIHSFFFWVSSGRKSWFNGANGVVFGLIIANAAVFTMWKVYDRKWMFKNFVVRPTTSKALNLLSFYLIFSSCLLIFVQLSLKSFMTGRIHTLITSGFTNVGTSQLIMNMIGLYYFGTRVWPLSLTFKFSRVKCFLEWMNIYKPIVVRSQEPWDRPTFWSCTLRDHLLALFSS